MSLILTGFFGDDFIIGNESSLYMRIEKAPLHEADFRLIFQDMTPEKIAVIRGKIYRRELHKNPNFKAGDFFLVKDKIHFPH